MRNASREPGAVCDPRRMMRLEYAGGSVLTGEAIANAVIRYAAALAKAQSAVSLDVPGITEEGVEGTFTILLGPASQILIEPTDDDADITDDEFVASLDREIEALERPRQAHPFDSDEDFTSTDDFE
jgi:hypothetical protein